MAAFYNENDPYAAEWLRNLIDAGEIPPGVVDERSITEIKPADLAGCCQVHLFAGIGGWPLALRIAGWTDDEPVWTGSCPCQPFSVAGAGAGTSDARHLWPDFNRLVRECRPTAIFGEQVAQKAGRAWLAGVRADLEASGYAVGASDLPAACVGAPHIRQRLWWVAYADGGRLEGPNLHLRPRQVEATVEQRGLDQGLSDAARGQSGMADADGRDSSAEGVQRGGGHLRLEKDEASRRLADADGAGLAQREGERRGARPELETVERAGRAGEGLGNAGCERRQQERRGAPSDETAYGRKPDGDHVASGAGATGEGLGNTSERGGGTLDGESRSGDRPEGKARGSGAWDDYEWIPCIDGAYRRTQLRLHAMADGVSGIMGGSCASEEKEGVVDADATEIRPGQDVPALRSEAVSQTVSVGPTRGSRSVSEAGLLQPRVHGGRAGEDARTEPDELASSVCQEQGEQVRGMRDDQEAALPSHRREPDEQRPVEPDDVVRYLSSALALPSWEAELEANGILLHLRQAAQRAGLVFSSLPALPTAWRTSTGETRNRIGQRISAVVEWRVVHPLRAKEPSRVGKLRAYGNAISPPLAAEFVIAAEEARRDNR